jgi:hypothetical protein
VVVRGDVAGSEELGLREVQSVRQSARAGNPRPAGRTSKDRGKACGTEVGAIPGLRR